MKPAAKIETYDHCWREFMPKVERICCPRKHVPVYFSQHASAILSASRDEKRFSFILWISFHFYFLSLSLGAAAACSFLSEVIFNDVLKITLPHLPTVANNLILLFSVCGLLMHSLVVIFQIFMCIVGMALVNPL